MLPAGLERVRHCAEATGGVGCQAWLLQFLIDEFFRGNVINIEQRVTRTNARTRRFRMSSHLNHRRRAFNFANSETQRNESRIPPVEFFFRRVNGYGRLGSGESILRMTS